MAELKETELALSTIVDAVKTLVNKYAQSNTAQDSENLKKKIQDLRALQLSRGTAHPDYDELQILISDAATHLPTEDNPTIDVNPSELTKNLYTLLGLYTEDKNPVRLNEKADELLQAQNKTIVNSDLYNDLQLSINKITNRLNPNKIVAVSPPRTPDPKNVRRLLRSITPPTDPHIYPTTPSRLRHSPSVPLVTRDFKSHSPSPNSELRFRATPILQEPLANNTRRSNSSVSSTSPCTTTPEPKNVPPRPSSAPSSSNGNSGSLPRKKISKEFPQPSTPEKTYLNSVSMPSHYSTSIGTGTTEFLPTTNLSDLPLIPDYRISEENLQSLANLQSFQSFDTAAEQGSDFLAPSLALPHRPPSTSLHHNQSSFFQTYKPFLPHIVAIGCSLTTVVTLSYLVIDHLNKAQATKDFFVKSIPKVFSKAEAYIPTAIIGALLLLALGVYYRQKTHNRVIASSHSEQTPAGSTSSPESS